MATVQYNVDRYLESLEPKIEGKLQRVGALVKRKVVKKLSVPFRQGNEVTRYDHKQPRQGTPSKPGEPPRADLGGLRQSIFYNVLPKDWAVEIGTTVEYGLDLELGTRHMAARPFLRPTVAESRSEIERVFNR